MGNGAPESLPQTMTCQRCRRSMTLTEVRSLKSEMPAEEFTLNIYECLACSGVATNPQLSEVA